MAVGEQSEDINWPNYSGGLADESSESIFFMVSGTANRNFEMLWNLPNSYSKVSFSIPLKSKSVKKMDSLML